MSSSGEMFVLMIVTQVVGWLGLGLVGLVLLGVYRGVRALFRAITGRPRPAVESGEPEDAAVETAEPEDAVPPGYDLDGSG
ncbi:hypothetical protein ACWDR3_31600 [Streptomyces sp. NPDC001002]